jgi:hypothetical protein
MPQSLLALAIAIWMTQQFAFARARVGAAGARWFVRDAKKGQLGEGDDIDSRAVGFAFDTARELASSTLGPAGSDIVEAVRNASGPANVFRPTFQAPESMVASVFQALETLKRTAGKLLDGDDANLDRSVSAAITLVSAATGAPLGGPEQAARVAYGLATQATED